MAQIEINCIGQTAIYTNMPEIFSGDVNIDTVKFTFDEVWDGYTEKTAVFYNNPKDTYPVMLDENNVAVVPEAVMADKCKLSIGVFGVNANGDVKTSKILTYNIGKGAISNDLEATTPPEFWTQLLTRQINFETNLTQRQDNLETNLNIRQNIFETELTQRQDTFESDMENEFNKLQTNVTNNVDALDSIIKGRNQALSYTSYTEMITALNSMDAEELQRGQNIYIGTVGVPDLWVYSVEAEYVEYTYVDDDTFIEGLNGDVTVQVGYYKLAQLETQKVDLTNIEDEIDDLTDRVVEIETNGGSGSSGQSGISSWELWASGNSGENIDLPTEWEELKILSYHNNSATFIERIITKAEHLEAVEKSTTSYVKYIGIGGTGSTSANTVIVQSQILMYDTYITLSSLIYNNSTSSGTYSIYYKKKNENVVNVGTESNWAYFGYVDGENSLNLPSEWEELMIQRTYNYNNDTYNNTVYVTKSMINANKTDGSTYDVLRFYCDDKNKAYQYKIQNNVLTLETSTTGYIQYNRTHVYYKKKCDNVLDITHSIGSINWNSKITEFTATNANNATTKEKSYTAERDCYMYLSMSSGSTGGVKFYINDVLIKAITGSSSNYRYIDMLIPIKKGQTVKGTAHDGNGSAVTCTFYDIL